MMAQNTPRTYCVGPQLLLFILFVHLSLCGFLLKCDFIVTVTVSARKTRDMIYTDVTGFSPCVRRFNATHQIGCASDFYGNTGVIHYMTNESDVQWLIDNGPYQPYIGLMEPQVFNLSIVKMLSDSGKLSGLMVINVNMSQIIQEDFYFSPDLKCPNDNFGFYDAENSSSEYAHCKSLEWNPSGNGMSFLNFNMPIIALYNETEIDYLKKCYYDHNEPINGKPRRYPLCAVEVKSFMFGAKDTPTCMRRSGSTTNLEISKFCDPLGDYNVWATLKPTNKETPLNKTSVIVVAAQLDSFSMFYEVRPSRGAEHAATGYITLLAVAQALGSLSNATKKDMDDIMLVFFQGESYDYIGSSRMVYDMLNGSFPYVEDKTKTQPAFVHPENISFFLELKQLGLIQDGRVYAHSDPITNGADEDTKKATTKLIDSLRNGSAGMSINIEKPGPNQPVPPASFQQFLRSGVKVPGIVLTDHEKEYRNKYYNSRFDNPDLLDFKSDENSTGSSLAKNLSDVATTVARALYQLARPSATDSQTITANETIIQELLYCFLVKADCPLFNSVVSQKESSNIQNLPYDGYVGVFGSDQQSLRKFIFRLLGYFTGNRTWVEHKEDDDESNQCTDSNNDQIFHRFFMQGPNPVENHGYCVECNVNLAKAQSPAFISGQENWKSTEYSTWTESQWSLSSFSARVYLKPSPEQENVIFCLGMVILLISLLLSYFVNARAGILFSSV